MARVQRPKSEWIRIAVEPIIERSVFEAAVLLRRRERRIRGQGGPRQVIWFSWGYSNAASAARQWFPQPAKGGGTVIMPVPSP
mgnify:CR=1 FL=1